MTTRIATVWSGLAVSLLICALAHSAAAEMTFDPQNYRAMVDASSSDTIPTGTKITLQNWQQYKQFMPTWLQAAFRGDYHWKLGPGPEFAILVGPTSNFPLPAIYLRDTEKFHNQVQLEQTSWGGYTIKNYTAGVPFPAPTEPNLAVKVMYNAWLPWRPFASRYLSYDKLVDQYGNISNEDTDNTFFQMAYLSDEGYPNLTPYAQGYFQAGHYFVTSPEQSKYTTSLQLQPMDPTKLQELYVFLPSLRRSLRLSSAARCTPLLGTDYIADDGAWLPPNFKPSFMGVKKILNLVLDPEHAYDSKTYAGGGGVPSGTFPGWPVAGRNHWELRTDYVIDLLALPVLGNYCYSHRVFYIDQQTWITAMAGAENYDRTGKLYKILWTAQAPINLKGVTTTYDYATGMSMAMDFQNQHTTWNNDTAVQFDNDVPAEYRDPINATPAGLERILR